MAEKAGKATNGGEAEKSLKDKGNEFFKAGNFLKAAALYTQAIKLDPSNATLYRFSFTTICNLTIPIGFRSKMIVLSIIRDCSKSDCWVSFRKIWFFLG